MVGGGCKGEGEAGSPPRRKHFVRVRAGVALFEMLCSHNSKGIVTFPAATMLTKKSDAHLILVPLG